MNYNDLPKYEGSVVDRIAEENGVAPQALWQCYWEVMTSNFEQDLYDIMQENEDEIREESENYES